MNNDFPEINAKFFPGDWVKHVTLGEGCIVGITPKGKATVKFKNVIQTVEVYDCEHIDFRRDAKRP